LQITKLWIRLFGSVFFPNLKVLDAVSDGKQAVSHRHSN